MTQFYTPWVERKPLSRRGLTGLVVSVAQAVHRMAAPLLRENAFFIFFGALFGGIAGIWVISLLSETYLADYPLLRDILAVTGVTIFIAHIPLFAIWWERKVAGHIQSRPGPMRVGGWHGWAQSFADGIKLVSKEDLVPAHADKPLYLMAPYVTLVPVVVAFLVIPFGSYWVIRSTDTALVFVLAMLGVEVVGVIMAGWASNSKWTVYGAMREACQMVSYEVPLGISLLLPVMTVGTLDLTAIAEMQAGGYHTWLCFQSPFLFAAAFMYYVASLASCKRAPFDLPESESELVAGFLTEYSGIRWALFFFAEYAAMYIVSVLSVILFFGGWYWPWSYPAIESAFAWAGDGAFGRAIRGLAIGGPIVLVIKTFALIYVQMWVRWTLPRIRIDQVLYACVQVMLPIVMALLLGHTLWMLWVPEGGMLWQASNYLFAVVGALLVLGCLWIVLRALLAGRSYVGNLAVDLLPGS